MKKLLFMSGALVTLAACEDVAISDVSTINTASSIGGQKFVRNLPDGVAEVAAPNQDLSRVALLEADNCYWYAHDGPVETTLLPLRTKNGRPICASQAAPEETAES